MTVSTFSALTSTAARATPRPAKPRATSKSNERSASPLNAQLATATFPLAGAPSDEKVPSSAAQDREDWIQRSLLRQYMTEAQARTPLGSLLAITLSLVCFSLVPVIQIALWLGVVLAWNVAHLRLTRWFFSAVDASTPARRSDFVRHVSTFYAAIGVLWGLAPLLFFDRLDDIREFTCWAMLACMLYGPAHRLALVPSLQRAYTNALFGTSFLSVVLISIGENKECSVLFWFLPVALLQLWMTRCVASDVRKTQSDLYGVQFDLAAKTEKALAAVDAKNRFLAAATHDMRQPVIAMGLYAEFLEADPQSYKTLAPKIGRATAAVNALFNSLFDLAALDNGQITLAVEPVAIADVICSLQTDFEPHAQAKQLELRVRVAHAVLQTDATRLRRMIGNVLSNAIKYSRPGAKILLAVRTQGGRVRVEVWDQGIGIPADQVSKIFQEFYRSAGSAELAPDGMGIGLSLVARLAEALNCRVTIGSVEGRGTRVSIEIRDVDPDPAKRKALSIASG